MDKGAEGIFEFFARAELRAKDREGRDGSWSGGRGQPTVEGADLGSGSNNGPGQKQCVKKDGMVGKLFQRF